MLTQKILAFLALLFVQVSVSIVYKYSQTKGKYAYSPLAIIACAEIIKLCISLLFFLFSFSTIDKTNNSNRNIFTFIQEQITKIFLLNTFGLASLYCLNNQLFFFLLLYVDPASISLFKSLSSIETAILLWALFTRHISQIQWGSICLQVIGLIIVQYDSCKNSPLFAAKFYFLLTGTSFVTAFCSVFNEHLVKTYNVNINLQNIFLYTFGFILNLLVFFLFPHIYNQEHIGFFQGYSWIVVAVMCCNSLLGIAITFVYKYADAIIKTFSASCATGVLLFLNVSLFHAHATLTSFLGASVIFIAAYIYFLSSNTPIVLPLQQQEQQQIASSTSMIDLETNKIEENSISVPTKSTVMFKGLLFFIFIVIGILGFMYAMIPINKYKFLRV